MQVLDFHGIAVQMQRQVCMVVVMDILRVHHHVLEFMGTLCHRDRSKGRHGLPQKHRQKNKGTKSAAHG
jgi:hypothetical protein